MTCIINASTTNNLQMSSDGSGIVKVQSNGVTTNALAWVNFGYVSSAITIRASYNVSSVTRNGAGDYTINFSTNTTDANYSINGSCASPGSLNNAFIAPYTSNPTNSSCRVGTYNFSLFQDSTYVSVSIFGN